MLVWRSACGGIGMIWNRITIVMDHDILYKLRKIQADKIQKTKKNYSLSRAANDILRGALK